MGFALLGLIGIVAVAILWWLGVARGLWSLVVAALVLGAAGYVWQARAGLAGKPVVADTVPIDVDPGMVAFRGAIFASDRETRVALATSDARMRSGDTGAAVREILAALDRRPRDVALWTGLGNALATHDGQVSPAALFAFRRAFALGPRQPGPPFFLGLAYASAGDFAQARAPWLHALALTPRDAPWRTDIAERLMLIDQFLAMEAGRRR